MQRPYVRDLGGNTGKTGIAVPVGPQAGSLGARFIAYLDECGSSLCERFQMGGYVSF